MKTTNETFLKQHEKKRRKSSEIKRFRKNWFHGSIFNIIASQHSAQKLEILKGMNQFWNGERAAKPRAIEERSDEGKEVSRR